jgi:hypothetical protein
MKALTNVWCMYMHFRGQGASVVRAAARALFVHTNGF